MTGFSGTTNTRSAAGRDNIAKKRSHHEFRNNFFSSRVADEWNALPDDIKSARTVNGIEEVWRKKPRQTDVVVSWGKIAAHMLLFRLCSRRVDKRRAGSKIWGDICILHFFIIDRFY